MDSGCLLAVAALPGLSPNLLSKLVLNTKPVKTLANNNARSNAIWNQLTSHILLEKDN